MRETEKPLISICCITFNQERYIKKTIEGFLKQKITYPIEIIIHDDASTDNTVNIIKEFHKNYPTIIKPIFQTVNQYQLGKRGSYFAFKEANGKYIAFCEGDDYWIDQYKLQKQVDFLEANPDCTISGHRIILYYDAEQKFGDPFPSKYIPEISNINLFLSHNFIPSLSIVFRREIIENLPDIYFKVPFGDYILKVLCAEKGKIGFINQIMGVYRIHNKGVSQGNKMQFLKMRINNIEQISNYLNYRKDLKLLLLKNRIEKAFLLYEWGAKNRFKIYFQYILSNSASFMEIIYIGILIIKWKLFPYLKLVKKSIKNHTNIDLEI
ncbi:glycosyltransferase [Promethearchaeum syntrophicum]|uniref:Glycosyltransferase n=1 Tax=Promethearchaeum syntrophicum TaxID=2594042 RepID=A0A5B9DA96_9ARCH|nr:glycosyltransferase [Candidatus Prometheoarchaeum syntrophicum]QEE16064.1 putative glycosyl transferase [Candidatus Prometheoarchaeum syntrophicum]